MIHWYAFLLIMIATLIGAVGALYLKKGAAELKGSLLKKILTKNLWFGLFLYGIASLFSFIALKNDNLSAVYALTSMSYIWVILIARKYLKEKINIYKWIGVCCIILGVVLLTL